MEFTKLTALFTLVLFVSLNSWSKVNLKKTKPLILPVDISEPLISKEMSDEIQPKSIGDGESASSVVSKIADRTMAYVWDHSALKNTKVGQAAEKVEKKLKAEVQLSDAKSKTQHKLTFKVLAMQTLAKIEYKGWMNAALNYDVRSARAEAEVSEKISKRQDLVVSHAVTRDESKSQVALRWNW